MTTTLSSKGQIVVPRSVRAKLGLQPGTQFDVRTDGDNVVLAPRGARKAAQLKRDRQTGLPTVHRAEGHTRTHLRFRAQRAG